MYDNKRILALIPARGGSKGLLRKNIKLINNKPLIAWTIESANNNKYIDKVIVSSDDDEIIDISQKYGAEIPFTRPELLSGDNAKAMDVILHAIEQCNDFDILIYLQPTSPLRTSKHIDEAIDLFFKKDAVSVISVAESKEAHTINQLSQDLSMENFIEKKYLNINRQDVNKKFYKINGAIYLSYFDNLKKNKNW